jgi:SAM-dependent methyltransferase
MTNPHRSSFRDSSGYVYEQDGEIYRVVMSSARSNYDLLMQSGLYTSLVESNRLIPHKEVDAPVDEHLSDIHKVLHAVKIPLITYPYEWSFSQLKDAALLTLDVAIEALAKEMVIKDATAFNIQFFNGAPIFIDTLSFAKYEEGSPWGAYRQFIQHFLAPLLLMSHTSADMNALLRVYIDGIPLQIARTMLPRRLMPNPLIFLNIYLHGRYEDHYRLHDKKAKVTLTRSQLKNSLLLLRRMVESISLKRQKTTWGDYYSATNYTAHSLSEKESVVLDQLKNIAPKFTRIMDLGANNGKFSRAISHLAELVLSVDIDPNAVDENYNINKQSTFKNIVPMRIDFTNPSPALGWAQSERDSFITRTTNDVIVSLAFIHHMVLAENVPFSRVAEVLSRLAKDLIIEFPDRDDSQVQRLLSHKPENHRYDRDEFEKGFERFYDTREKVKIKGSERWIYNMRKKC